MATTELREDIIRMAREAGFSVGPSRDGPDDVWGVGANLERFFRMAQAAEREACHALRQALPNPHEHCQVSAHAYDMAIVAYGKAIRERGQA
jgi:hypothetical protein